MIRLIHRAMREDVPDATVPLEDPALFDQQRPREGDLTDFRLRASVKPRWIWWAHTIYGLHYVASHRALWLIEHAVCASSGANWTRASYFRYAEHEYSLASLPVQRPYRVKLVSPGPARGPI